MSDTSARANLRAFWFGSFARNGLIGLRCTAAGGGAGVDGVENAADTLLVVVRFDGVADLGGGGGSGIEVREGGVSGAPNIALSDGVLSGARGA
jgi:hypothetical protein